MWHRLFSRENIRAGAWVLLAFPICALLFVAFVWHRAGDREISHRDLEQRAQFNGMGVAIELFNNEFDAYPPSDANDPTGQPYCGAMKLAEALMGQDLSGFHPGSIFRADGLDPNTLAPLYSGSRSSTDSLKARRGPYVQMENANAFRLVDIYGKGNTGPFPENTFVLCDVFDRERPSGKRTGMPILYYRANLSRTLHDVNNPDDPRNIYDYRDNQALVSLGVPGNPNAVHPLADPKRFYLNPRDHKMMGALQPYKKDSFILISAGWDGLYGTADDIYNFRWKYRER